ncbi:hypothetical protein [Janibacter melonis]|uniref:hypothetical protein n=1 Tax=Janibacter melonis TaxID=262209 RepID=UPI000F408D89|nr:hypothetical protein [Janibacter melonis]
MLDALDWAGPHPDGSRLDNLLPLSTWPWLCVRMTFGLWISVLPLLAVAVACVHVLVAKPR